MDIEKKLINVKYKTSDKPHLILNQEICKVCEDKVCLNVCPGNVYKQNVSRWNTKIALSAAHAGWPVRTEQ